MNMNKKYYRVVLDNNDLFNIQYRFWWLPFWDYLFYRGDATQEEIEDRLIEYLAKNLEKKPVVVKYIGAR